MKNKLIKIAQYLQASGLTQEAQKILALATITSQASYYDNDDDDDDDDDDDKPEAEREEAARTWLKETFTRYSSLDEIPLGNLRLLKTDLEILTDPIKLERLKANNFSAFETLYDSSYSDLTWNAEYKWLIKYVLAEVNKLINKK